MNNSLREGLPSYCYDPARPRPLSDDEQAKLSAAWLDRLIREHEAKRA